VSFFNQAAQEVQVSIWAAAQLLIDLPLYRVNAV